MRYRKLSPTGDYTFGQSQQNFWINSPNGVAQSVQTNLELFLGEWYLDQTAGVPYFQGVLGNYSQAVADQTEQDYVSNIFGVSAIVNFASTLNPITRQYTITLLRIQTIYSTTVVTVIDTTISEGL
jgi:hypothetical protein